MTKQKPAEDVTREEEVEDTPKPASLFTYRNYLTDDFHK